MTIQDLRATAALPNGQRLELAMRVGRLGRWELDLASGALQCDEHWHQIMGLDFAHPVTTADEFTPVIHPEDRAAATEVTQTVSRLVERDEDYGIEFRIVRPDGEIRWVRSLASLVDEVDGVPQRAVGMLTDITETVALREQARRNWASLAAANSLLLTQRAQLERLSLTDGLTQIANRRSFDQTLERLLIDSERTGRPLAIAMIDIDFFKSFNDSYGHLAGDAALRSVASALASTPGRPFDLAARFGGEEFAVLLPGCTQLLPVLEPMAARIAALDIPHAGSTVSSRLSVSIAGASFAPPFGASGAELLARCDEALYAAKSTGRNRIVVL